jgi:hypothetical protein
MGMFKAVLVLTDRPWVRSGKQAVYYSRYQTTAMSRSISFASLSEK